VKIFNIAILFIAFSAFSHANLIQPETSTPVELSSKDINRFVCVNGLINDVYYSEEKGIQVKNDGKNSFVKFLIKNNGIRKEYVTTASEFFIVCDGETYSIIGNPKSDIEAQTYRLGSSYKQQLDNIKSIFGALPDEEKAVLATQMVYKNDSDLLRKIESTQYQKDHSSYKIDGYGLLIKEYRIEAKQDIQSLQEIQFLNRYFGNHIFAITVIPQSLKAGSVGQVFIVEKE
jgi:conjugal transfer pilus assembly protein TraK